MILPNDQLKEDGQNVMVEVQDVRLDVEIEVDQGVKMLEVGDDESDFSFNLWFTSGASCWLHPLSRSLQLLYEVSKH